MAQARNEPVIGEQLRREITRLKNLVKSDTSAVSLVNTELSKIDVQRTQGFVSDLYECVQIVHGSGLPLSQTFMQSRNKQTANISELLNLQPAQIEAAHKILNRLKKEENRPLELDQLTFERIIYLAKNRPEIALNVSKVIYQMHLHGTPVVGNRRELMELQDYQLDYLHSVLQQLGEGQILDANAFKVLLKHAQGLGDPALVEQQLTTTTETRDRLRTEYGNLEPEWRRVRNEFLEAQTEYNDNHTQMVPDPDNPGQERREIIPSQGQIGALQRLQQLQVEEKQRAEDLGARRIVLDNMATEIERLKTKIANFPQTGVLHGHCVNSLINSKVNLNYSLGGSRLETLVGLETKDLTSIDALLRALSTAQDGARDTTNYLDARTFDFIMKEMSQANSTKFNNRGNIINVFYKMRALNIPLKGSRQELLMMSAQSLEFLNSVLRDNNAVDESAFAALRKSAVNLQLNEEDAKTHGDVVNVLMRTMKANNISDTEWLKHDKLTKIVELPSASIVQINSIFTSLAAAQKDGVKSLDKKTAHYIINNAVTMGPEKLGALAEIFKFMQENCSEAIIGNRQPLMKLDIQELVVLLGEMEKVKGARGDGFDMTAKQVSALIDDAKKSKAELYPAVANVEARVEAENPSSEFRAQVDALKQNDELGRKAEAALQDSAGWKFGLGS